MTSQQQPHGTDADPVTLGEYMRSARLKRRLSLQQLANAAGVHKSYLGRLELGQLKQPSPEVLQKIARALDIEYENLFALTGYRLPDELPSLVPYLRSRYHMSDDDIRKVNRFFQDLPHTDRAKTSG